MTASVVVWGYGNAYFNVANTLDRLVEKGQVEIVAYVGDSLPSCGWIAGAPIIHKSDLLHLEYDVLVVCISRVSEETIGQICETWGVPREKVVPARVLRWPSFDMDDYLELKRSNISIISDLCFGGYLYKALGLPCLSPFRNLFIEEKNYLRLLSDLRRYCTETELTFHHMTKPGELEPEPYPVMSLDDVEVRFNHAKTPEEAAEEWNKRRERINWDNLFVQMKTTNIEDELVFNRLEQFEKRICFVPYETELAHSFYVPNYGGGSEHLFDRVNAAGMLGTGSHLINPIQMLLGRPDFRRYTTKPQYPKSIKSSNQSL